MTYRKLRLVWPIAFVSIYVQQHLNRVYVFKRLSSKFWFAREWCSHMAILISLFKWAFLFFLTPFIYCLFIEQYMYISCCSNMFVYSFFLIPSICIIYKRLNTVACTNSYISSVVFTVSISRIYKYWYWSYARLNIVLNIKLYRLIFVKAFPTGDNGACLSLSKSQDTEYWFSKQVRTPHLQVGHN